MTGLQRTLPLTLVITFALVPSTATLIFRTLLCDPYEYVEPLAIAGQTPSIRRYLQGDLTVDCDSAEYQATRGLAFVFIAVWPIGCPALYMLLIWGSIGSHHTRSRRSLLRATAFLTEDYHKGAFWWEPVEMCRKLALVGWVLLIGEQSELARVLVALIVSISFLALHFAVKPTRRREDGALMMTVELVLVLIYICVMLIKVCDLSPTVCANYGFGDDATGLYVFFIFIAISMLSFQLLVIFLRLWTEGRVPKILLLATAHSISPTMILRRVAVRRWHPQLSLILAHPCPSHALLPVLCESPFCHSAFT